MTEEKKKVKEITIAPINVCSAVVKIKGKTPLLMDKMPQDVKDAILGKQTGVTKTNKQLRDTKKEVIDAIHYTAEGKIGFPSAGFKAGMIESTSFVGDKFFSKKLIRGIKVLNGPIIPIKYDKQDILEHNVGPNTKFSPQFHNWECELDIQYDANNTCIQDIITLLNYAGFYYGLGMWSPRCRSGGDFGMYEVKANGKKV
ncbi:MAG: hypothetical protein CL811_10535 [Colwelliaceae bacterium]|jgi:hypothetical protein|nr:hypothetical protein [Colwelliaceae bacterium]|tara:strand:+ start:2769 stop:3368 length:600 start_codon:yes stop_codon:yes gene_type:complete